MGNIEAHCAELNFLVFTHGINCLEERLENDSAMQEEQEKAYRETIKSWERKRWEYFAMLPDDTKDKILDVLKSEGV